MKYTLVLIAMLATPALAQVPVSEQPLDDLTAAYMVCVAHQERIVPSPVPPTPHDYRYSGVWAEKCPAVEMAFQAQERSKKTNRDAADLAKVNKVLK